MYKGLPPATRKELEFEVVSDSVRLNIARLFRAVTRREEGNSDVEIILKNRIVNIARQVEGLPLYRLETDDEYYYPPEKAWHFAELELVTRRPDAATLIEILCDLLEEELLDLDDVNDVFAGDNSRLLFCKDSEGAKVRVTSVNDIPDDDVSSEHPNIRKLIHRMETLLGDEDWAGVLHACASVFETLAKDVIGNPSIENKTLGSFFDSYKKRSELSEPVLEMIKSIYDRRGSEPLAGHGQTKPPTIEREEAVTLAEMTKALVRIERKLAEPQVSL